VSAAEQNMAALMPQELLNVAWACSTAALPTPASLDPLAVLDTCEVRSGSALPSYQVSMQCLASSGQIVSGLALLARAEARGLLSGSLGEDCYQMKSYHLFRMLLEACCMVGNFDSASRVQAVQTHFGLLALPPEARALVRGSERRYGNNNEGVGDACKLWSELCSRTAYELHWQVLPWAFVRSSTHKQQKVSLQLHPEKRALAVLLASREARLIVNIEFNMCMDCHAFFKSSALLLGRSTQVCQSRMAHTFADHRCSCDDRWCWEVRLMSAAL